MPTIKVNDAAFYYEIHGQGAPLVLIAGYTGTHLTWLPMLEKLAAHFQVIVFDNRGVGRTKDSNIALNAQQMAADVAGIIRALGFEKAHVAGSSMGGTIAQTVAANHPEVVDKLVLLVTSAKWRTAMLKGLYTIVMMREQDSDFDIIFESMLAWVFGEAFLQNQKSVTLLKHAILEDPYPQSLEDQKRQYEVLTTFDGRENLTKINAPTLVAYGNEDLISLPHESIYLANQIAGATLKEFACAHGISSEVPDALVDEMITFLQ